MSEVRLHLGDCVSVMAAMDENSFDTCITDPPYHLKSIVKRFGKNGSAPAQFGVDGRYARASKGFMGKEWDGGDVAFRPETWAAVLRVLKPGAMLLAFGGTRTYHRLTCAIEDAGFDIRDCIFWIYGSGFPKSHNLKLDGWDGWGTALKPACEPIVVAMKPLDGTFAQNAEKWGVAGMNIDGGRIETKTVNGGNLADNTHLRGKHRAGREGFAPGTGEYKTPIREFEMSGRGRWPANVLLDKDAALVLDRQSGASKSRVGSPRGTVKKGLFANSEFNKVGTEHSDTGGASRFFYVAKASRREREMGLEGEPLRESATANFGFNDAEGIEARGRNPENHRLANANNHPTVKPLTLMRYLCKLTATPTGGIVLDPFMGSGTTGIAAVMEGRDFVGIEKESDYKDIAEKRIAEAQLQERMPI